MKLRHFVGLAGLCFAGVFAAACGNGADDADHFAFEQSQAAPFEILEFGSGSLKTNDSLSVRFFDESGFSVVVPAISSDPLSVVIPMHFDRMTGEVSSKTVSAEVVFTNGERRPVEGELLIESLPVVDFEPGTLTLAFLEGEGKMVSSTTAALSAMRDEPDAGHLVTTELVSIVSQSAAQIESLRMIISAVADGTIPFVDIAKAQTSDGEVSLKIDQASLADSDRIVAALLVQLRNTQRDGFPTGRGLVPFALEPDFLDFAKNWATSLNEEISQDWLDWGAKVGNTVAQVAAVGGLAVALVATTPAMTALGTTLAIAGAVVYLSSTFVPVMCSTFTKIGASIALEEQGVTQDLMPELKYMVSNTIAAGSSQIAQLKIEEVSGSALSAATFDMFDNVEKWTSEVGTFVADVADSFSTHQDTDLHEKGQCPGENDVPCDSRGCPENYICCDNGSSKYCAPAN